MHAVNICAEGIGCAVVITASLAADLLCPMMMFSSCARAGQQVRHLQTLQFPQAMWMQQSRECLEPMCSCVLGDCSKPRAALLLAISVQASITKSHDQNRRCCCHAVSPAALSQIYSVGCHLLICWRMSHLYPLAQLPGHSWYHTRTPT